jgi:hypothetical protein
MKRKLIGGALTIAALSAIFGAAGYTRTTVVKADCTKTIPGKSLATESGTLVCDCTNGGPSCSCIVPAPCPPGGGGIGIEEGGSQ